MSGEQATSRARRLDMFWVVLSAIALTGLVLRIAYVLWMRDQLVWSDGWRFHFGALLIADGYGFQNPSRRAFPDTGHPPAWTVVLAGPSWLGLRSWLSHQLVACVVGTGTIVMTGLAGRAAFGRRAGLIAAALAAVYAGIWLYEREVVSEPLTLLGVATAIWLSYRFHAKPSVLLVISLGAIVGLLAMTRSEQLAFAGVVAVLILTAAGVAFSRRLRWLALAAITCIAVMAPWSIYLSTRFDRVILYGGGGAAALTAGNCDETYSGDLLGYYNFGCAIRASRTADGPDPLADEPTLRRYAFDYIRDHKAEAVVVAGARVGRTFGVFRPFQQMHLETERGTQLWVMRLAFVEYWLLLPFALAGAVIARRRRIMIYPLLAVPVIVFFAVVLTIGAVRYRAPAEIPLVLLAAFAIDDAVQRWTPRRASTEATPEPPPERVTVSERLPA